MSDTLLSGTPAISKNVMSQSTVRELLKELGGRATTAQVSALAKARFPSLSLYQYVGQRLRTMEKWGEVKRDGGVWVLLR